MLMAISASPGGSAAFAWCTLAAQADLLALGDAGGNPHLDLAAIRKHHAPGAALGCFGKRDDGGELDVGALARLVAPPPAGAQAAENVGENVLAAAALIAAPVKLEAAGLPCRRRWHCAEEPLEPVAALRAGIKSLGLARLVDFAAVVLGALFLVAHHLIGGIQLLKFLHRLGVVAVLIGMMFFGKRAEGLFDLGLVSLLEARPKRHRDRAF